jgi:hypothetical protein
MSCAALSPRLTSVGFIPGEVVCFQRDEGREVWDRANLYPPIRGREAGKAGPVEEGCARGRSFKLRATQSDQTAPNLSARDARRCSPLLIRSGLGVSVRAPLDVGDQAAEVGVELVEVEFERFDALVHQNARRLGGFERVMEARHDVGRGASEILALGFVGHWHFAFRGRSRSLDIRRIATGDFSTRDENLS